MRVRRGERGIALLTALVVLLLVSLALALLAAALETRLRLVRQETTALQLGALADAALAEALYGITHDAHFAGHPEHPFGPGSLASEVTPLGVGRYRVVARGSFGGQARRVEAEVQRTPQGARVMRWAKLP